MKKHIEILKLNRMNDALMKYIFAKEERKHLSLNLINSFFEKKQYPTLPDFTFRDREQSPEQYHGKAGRLDILGSSSDGTTVNLEMQVKKLIEQPLRSIFYWGKLFIQRRAGTSYSDLKRTVCISILNYVQFTNLSKTRYYNTFSIRNDAIPHEKLVNILELHFFEIKKWEKLKNRFENMDNLEQWMAYFSNKTPKHILEKIAMSNAYIGEAFQTEHDVFMGNPNLVTLYDQEEKARMDEIASKEYALFEGIVIAYKDLGKTMDETINYLVSKYKLSHEVANVKYNYLGMHLILTNNKY